MTDPASKSVNVAPFNTSTCDKSMYKAPDRLKEDRVEIKGVDPAMLKLDGMTTFTDAMEMEEVVTMAASITVVADQNRPDLTEPEPAIACVDLS